MCHCGAGRRTGPMRRCLPGRRRFPVLPLTPAARLHLFEVPGQLLDQLCPDDMTDLDACPRCQRQPLAPPPRLRLVPDDQGSPSLRVERAPGFEPRRQAHSDCVYASGRFPIAPIIGSVALGVRTGSKSIRRTALKTMRSDEKSSCVLASTMIPSLSPILNWSVFG